MSYLPSLPVLIPDYLPPSRENWQLAHDIVKYLPVVTAVQWMMTYYPMGKTSVKSRFNLPGKFGWATMESPPLILGLYISRTLPLQQGIVDGFAGLPGPNKLLVGLLLVHYLQRAIVAPLFLNPSMAPIHVLPWSMAVIFNTLNTTQLVGWLSGYGPTTREEWAGTTVRVQVGLMIFCLGFFSNIFHDDELREIRRRARAEQEEKAKQQKQKGKDGQSAERVYKIPQGLLFDYILYPHYLSEWLEWAGYWMIGGAAFTAGRNFVVFEIATMFPRAVQGKAWYINKFGKENVGNKKAVIPFIGP